MSVVAGFLLLTFVAPGALAYALRNTRARWLPTFALTAIGVACFTTLEHTSATGFDQLGNHLQETFGVVMLSYAALIVGVSFVTREAPKQPPIPRATSRLT